MRGGAGLDPGGTSQKQPHQPLGIRPGDLQETQRGRRLFRRLKRFRRIFTRYDNLDKVFTFFVYFALIVDASNSVNTP